jgi:hypothetical protein
MNAKRLVAAGMLLCLTSAALAQDGRSWLNPRLGNAKTEITYTFRGYCDRDAKDQSEEVGMMRHEMAVSVPLHQDQTQEWLMFASYGAWDIDTAAVLPDTGDEFPSCLHDIRVGTSYRAKLDNGWLWGATVEVGSPSDKPFHSGDEVAVSARGFIRIPHGEKNAFLGFLAWSNTRDFAPYIPLPGAAYQWVPNDDLNIVAGVPFSSVRWTPIEKLTVSARYMVLRNVHAKVSYDLTDTLQIYGLFEWDNEHFFRYDRPDDDWKLTYYEKRVGGGVKIALMENVTLDLSGGWAFDRHWYEEEEYDDRDVNRVKLRDGAYVGAQVSWRF